MNRLQLGLLCVLAALWGLSFVFIRIATVAIGPVWLVAVRVTLAATALSVYALVTRATGPWADVRRRPVAWLALAASSGAMPFLLIATAELQLSAAVAAILNATVPLFTAAFAALWLSQPLFRTRLVGMALGFAGVVVLVGGGTLASGIEVAAAAASLGAAVLYALGIVYTRREFSTTPTLPLAIGMQGVSALLVAPLAVATGTVPHPSAVVVGAVLGLGLLCTALAYLIFYHLLQTAGPTPAASVTFLVPVFGLLWSYLLLGEPIALGAVAGLVLILLGVGLVTRAGPPR